MRKMNVLFDQEEDFTYKINQRRAEENICIAK